MINIIVMASCAQQSDSAIRIHGSILPSRLPHNIGKSPIFVLFHHCCEGHIYSMVLLQPTMNTTYSK